jgi:hypothetical protein
LGKIKNFGSLQIIQSFGHNTHFFEGFFMPSYIKPRQWALGKSL